MPVIGRINAQLGAPIGRYQRTSPADFGAIAAQEVAQMGDVFMRVSAAEDITEAHKLHGEGTAALRTALLQAEQAYPDPEEYRKAAQEGVKAAYESVLGRASNGRVKSRVEASLADNFGIANTAIVGGYFTKKKDKARADFDINTEAMSRAAAETSDELTRASFYENYGRMLGELRAENYLTESEMVNFAQAFDRKVTLKSADAAMRSDPETFLQELETPKYQKLDIDTRVKLGEQARLKIDRIQGRNDKLARDVKQMELDQAHALANQGELDPIRIDEALKGKDPYITPQEARELQRINTNPPTGAGTDNVNGIMLEYHSGPSSFGRIKAARDSLNALRRQIGSYNPAIDKALNELQTDERTMIGINAGQLNRQMRAAEDEYTATTETNPFVEKIFGNHRQQDKAAIRDAIRKGQDPKEVVKQKTTQDKNRADKIPSTNKKVIDLVR